MGEEKEIPINATDKAADQTEPAEALANNKADSSADQVETVEPVESKPQPEESTEERLTRELATAEEKLLLTMADFENYKKRQARRQEEFYRTANDALLLGVLEIVDNFERALAHAAEADQPESLVEGTKLIYNQLIDLIKKYNIEPIIAIGEEFDPNLHEAIMQLESDEFNEGVVALEINKGYKSAQRVLRHSRVGVSKGPIKPKSEESEETEESNDQ